MYVDFLTGGEPFVNASPSVVFTEGGELKLQIVVDDLIRMRLQLLVCLYRL
jgi:hypothetical protein